jgi:diaminopimelate epimerase
VKIDGIGPKIEKSPIFRNVQNVEFIEIIDRDTTENACLGTCEVARRLLVAQRLAGTPSRRHQNRCNNKVTVRLKGRDLQMEWGSKQQ